MSGRPDPIKFTVEEGGTWLPWGTASWHVDLARAMGRELLVHSVMFDDGSVFDAVNGWRNGKWDTLTNEPYC